MLPYGMSQRDHWLWTNITFWNMNGVWGVKLGKLHPEKARVCVRTTPAPPRKGKRLCGDTHPCLRENKRSCRDTQSPPQEKAKDHVGTNSPPRTLTPPMPTRHCFRIKGPWPRGHFSWLTLQLTGDVTGHSIQQVLQQSHHLTTVM